MKIIVHLCTYVLTFVISMTMCLSMEKSPTKKRSKFYPGYDLKVLSKQFLGKELWVEIDDKIDKQLLTKFITVDFVIEILNECLISKENEEVSVSKNISIVNKAMNAFFIKHPYIKKDAVWRFLSELFFMFYENSDKNNRRGGILFSKEEYLLDNDDNCLEDVDQYHDLKNPTIK